MHVSTPRVISNPDAFSVVERVRPQFSTILTRACSQDKQADMVMTTGPIPA